jgi:sporulation protein YlmC with PRC-barrel domain
MTRATQALPAATAAAFAMSSRVARLALAILLSASTVSARAEVPGKIDLEAAEIIAELTGAPVLASDGTEVGEVADIAFDEEAQPATLRMRTAAHLGLGTRIVEIPRHAFLTVRGAVVLDLTAEAVRALSSN